MADVIVLDTAAQIADARAHAARLRAYLADDVPLPFAAQCWAVALALAALDRVQPRIDLVDDREIPSWLRARQQEEDWDARR